VGHKESAEYLMAHTRQMVAWFGVQREPYRYTDNTLSLLGYPGHHRAAAEYALNQVVAGKLDLARMVTHHFPLEEYDRAVKLLKAQEAVKVCFLPWR
jgi:threonine dehydrogenase-like Zn-dependent dehydrogenase